MIRITIPLIPVGQKRARSCVIQGKARTYKAPEQRKAENTMLYFLDSAKPAEPMEGPLALSVVAYLPIPDSWSRKKRMDAIAGALIPTVKPDLDNMVKHVLDCMQTLKFFGDDKQVARMVLEKRYAVDARWEVEIDVMAQHPSMMAFMKGVEKAA